MKIAGYFLILTIWSANTAARGGDAVAFDYTTGLGGIYYSSTPEGGSDYETAPDARLPALTAAKKKGAQAPVVIHQTDLTGYFCLVVGLDKEGRFVAHVGHGDTAVDAKADAFRGVKAYGAISKPDVVQEYFSYGAKAKPSVGGRLLPKD